MTKLRPCAALTRLLVFLRKNASRLLRNPFHKGNQEKDKPILSGSRQTAFFSLFGKQIKPGSSLKHHWQSKDMSHLPVETIVMAGEKQGPILCLLAAMHGNEINGIEIARQIIRKVTPKDLYGVLICIPIVNVEGYLGGKRQVDTIHDLNRHFPGNPDGSYVEQLADFLMKEILPPCHAVIDLHTGSSILDNCPQIRADLKKEYNRNFIAGFGNIPVLHSLPPKGSLRAATAEQKIPSIVLETGGSDNLSNSMVSAGVDAVFSLMGAAGMFGSNRYSSIKPTVYMGSGVDKADRDGIFVCCVQLGQQVTEGSMVGEIRDSTTGITHEVLAPFECTILGRLHNKHVKVADNLLRLGLK